MCDSVFEAASDNNGKSIGVDVDQSSVSDTVITSAMKGLSAAAQKVLTSFYAGKWVLVGGLMSNLGVDDNAVRRLLQPQSLKSSPGASMPSLSIP